MKAPWRWGVASVLCLLPAFVQAETTVSHAALFHLPYEQAGFRVDRVTELTTDDPRFGGFSGLVQAPEGQIFSVTDQGYLAFFPDMTFETVRFVPLKDAAGTFPSDKTDRDAESLALDPKGGLLVSFEHIHQIRQYDQTGTLQRTLPFPYAANISDDNEGLEAIAYDTQGRLVTLAEGAEDADHTFIGRYDPTSDSWKRFRLPLREGFRPTGLTRLPDGTLLLLERFFKPFFGVKIRLSRLIATNGGYARDALGDLKPPLPVDNMEGVLAYQDHTGETRLILLSDDNFNPLQRTLLISITLK